MFFRSSSTRCKAGVLRIKGTQNEDKSSWKCTRYSIVESSWKSSILYKQYICCLPLILLVNIYGVPRNSILFKASSSSVYYQRLLLSAGLFALVLNAAVNRRSTSLAKVDSAAPYFIRSNRVSNNVISFQHKRTTRRLAAAQNSGVKIQTSEEKEMPACWR